MAGDGDGPSGAPEAFPALEGSTPDAAQGSGVVSSLVPQRLRRGTNWLLEQSQELPRGASQAFAQSIAQAPSIQDVRQGALTTTGEELYQRFENERTPSDLSSRRRRASLADDEKLNVDAAVTRAAGADLTASVSPLTRFETVYDLHRTASGTFPNGYRFPPKHTWKEAFVIGTKALIRFSFGSIFGFLVLIYALNVVAWGGMIFLLLCGAADKYMCTGYYVDHCSSKHAQKSRWIEIDAQILTGLFCVTAFGLLPWRAHDLYNLMQFRLQHKHIALRRLAATHKGWFRLPGSHHLDPLTKVPNPPDAEAEQYLPFPLEKGAEAPLTGVRAHDTVLWKMDFVVWLMMFNSVVQVPLCVVMWRYNRFTRPAWSTALLIVLGMLSAMAAGVVQLIEGKKIKAREGVPLTKVDLGKLADMERGAASGLEAKARPESEGAEPTFETTDGTDKAPGVVQGEEKTTIS